jgi:hypothetical protein
MNLPNRALLLACLLGSLPGPGAAQTVRGTVVEVDDAEVGREREGRPVVGATVELLSGGRRLAGTTLTDTLGVFILPAPGPGTFGLRVSHPSYLAYEAGGIDVGRDETVSLEIRVGRDAIPLEPLVVTARVNALLAGFHRRRTGGGNATFLTREEIEQRGATRATDLLRGLPGVRLDFVRWGMGPDIVMQGGFGACEPTIFLDGVELVKTAGVGSSMNDYITPDRIEGIEVYSSFSTVPAQFRAGMCGVILLWTRQGGGEGGGPWGWKRVLGGLAVAVGLMLWIR